MKKWLLILALPPIRAWCGPEPTPPITPAHVQFVNNNNSHIIQHFSGPGHTIEVTTRQNPKPYAQKINVENPPVSNISRAIALPLLSATPVKITLGATVLIYSALLAKHMYTEFLVHTTNTWSCWQREISLESLRQNEKKIALQLYTDVQKYYATPDVMTAVITFCQVVEEELDFLRSFLATHTWLEQKSLAWLFPAQTKARTIAQQKVERLEYLKELFVRFAGDYKKDASHPIAR